MPYWSTPEANTLYKDVTLAAASSLAAAGLVAAARAAQELSDTACAGISSTAQSACAPGCSACCVINVSILEPEAAAIGDYLHQTLTAHELAALRNRVNDLKKQTFGLDHTDRVIAALSCAFLDDSGCCIIHPARPLLCRSISSTDASDCSKALERLVEGHEHPINCHIAQREIYEAAFCGLASGMEQHGLDSSSHRLTDIILPFLITPTN
jgi:Fe-S-cluster containining protein